MSILLILANDAFLLNISIPCLFVYSDYFELGSHFQIIFDSGCNKRKLTLSIDVHIT